MENKRIIKDKVSLVVPVYNTGNYVHRLLDSILSQTYSLIEVIIVDDGSTDNSKEVVESYFAKFEDKKYELTYFRQENQGQSVAVINGLRMASGEFVAWPDSDDYYFTTDAITRMVMRLKNKSDEFRMVRTQEYIVKDETWEILGISGKNAKESEDKSLFEDCLFTKNGFYFCPGAYMVYLQDLIDETGLEIYTSKNAGQNWQLYLPILYKYRCTSICEPLYAYVSRNNSHSRGQFEGYKRLKSKYLVYKETEIETLKRIKGLPSDIEREYIIGLESMYNRRFLSLAIEYAVKEDVREFCLSLTESEKKDVKLKSLYVISYIPGGVQLLSFLLKVKRLYNKYKR